MKKKISPEASVLGQLLLMQNFLINLPDRNAIFSFVCKGLIDIPGIKTAHYVKTFKDQFTEKSIYLPIGNHKDNFGSLQFKLSDIRLFQVYEPYVKNFIFMVQIILEERQQRRIIELHSIELEKRVEDRTKQLKKEIKIRTNAEQQLLISKERYDLAMKASSDGLFDWNLETNAIYYSPGWKKMLGYEDNELPNDFSVWEETTNPEDVKKSWELQQKLIAKEVDRFVMEFKMKHKKGYWVDILSRAEAIFNDSGKAIRIVGTHTDVTQRKQMDEAISKSEAIKSKMVSNIGDVIVIIDKNGVNQYKSSNVTKLFGWKPEDLIGKGALDNIHPDDLEYSQKVITSLAVKPNSTQTAEVRYRRKDGKYVWIEITLVNLLLDSDIKGILGNYHDITERKIANEALRSSQEMLESSQSLAKICSYSTNLIVTDIEKSQWECSPEFYNIFGIDETYPHTIKGWIGFIHPDFREDLVTYHESIVLEKKSFNREYKIIRINDGVERWVHGTGNLIYDKDGEPIRMHGAIQDITERKQAELDLIAKNEELKQAKEKAEESEERFRGIYEQSPIAIEIYDKHGKLIDVNRQTLNMFGIDDKIHILGFDLWSDPNLSDEKMKWLKNGQEIFISTEFDFEIVKENKLYPTSRSGKIYMDLYAIPLFNEKEITGFLVQIVETTERKQAEESNIELLKRFELIGLHLPGVIYQFRLRADGTFHFPYSSHGITKIYGVTPEEVEHDASNAFKAIHPDDLERVSASINHSAQTLKPWHDVYRINQPSCKIIWVEGNSTPIKLEDGSITWHGFIQDITERKQAEQELIEAKEKAEENESTYLKLFSEIPDGVYKSTHDGKFIQLNPAMIDMLGYDSKEELLAVDIKSELYFDGSDRNILTLDAIQKELGVFRMRKKDGSEIWVEDHGWYTLDDSGNVLFHEGVIRDVTDRIKAEQELIAAKEKAEESDRLKSAFLANMSHEIRTPMNGILGFAELLKEPGLTGEEQQKFIGIIEKSGDRMLNIINDIISIAKIESGQLEVSVSDTNINEQIEFIYNFFKPEADKKGLQLSFNTSLSNDDTIIKTDREKFYAILTNLVKNAIKFTDKGSIEFGYNLKTVTEPGSIEPHRSAEVEFYVKDTGIGIATQKQKAIFERFIQADIQDKMARQGAGLGLSIAKAYVELLGGKIWLESELGVGSVFYFTFPFNIDIKEKTKTHPDVLSANEEKKIDAESAGLKILIVEDDENSGDYLSVIIKPVSKEILLAKSGIEAVEACRKNPDIDLVLMDIQMPNMNGYEATRQIREFNQKAVFIAQTAYALAGDKEKALEAGCNDYISKPIKKDELLALIQKYLHK